MLSSYIKYLVTLDSFFYGTHVNLYFDPIRVLIPMGYTQPMTRMYQNPYPGVRVRVLTGTGTGCPEKPQGSPCHSLRDTAAIPSGSTAEAQVLAGRKRSATSAAPGSG